MTDPDRWLSPNMVRALIDGADRLDQTATAIDAHAGVHLHIEERSTLCVFSTSATAPILIPSGRVRQALAALARELAAENRAQSSHPPCPDCTPEAP